MLTIFALPKAFKGQFATIQRNAVGSWKQMRPEPEVILFGDDPGVDECAAELGAKRERGLSTNSYGTPTIDGMFARGQRLASNDLLCYVNSDIILTSDFMPALEALVDAIGDGNFVGIGRKTNFVLERLIEFGDPDWEVGLRVEAEQRGEYVTYDSDYLVFRRGAWPKVPPFAIGRCYWSNWLMFDAKRRGLPLVDMTKAVLAIEPRHDYSHAKSTGGHARLSGPEFEGNRRLFKGCQYYTTVNSDFAMDESRKLGAPPSRNRVLGVTVRFEYWVYFLLKGRWFPYSMPLIWLARAAASALRWVKAGRRRSSASA